MAKRRGCLGRLIGTVITIAILAALLYVGLGVGDYFGLFVGGKYQTKEILGRAQTLTLNIGGKFDDGEEDSYFYGYTWRAVGDSVYIYDKDGERSEFGKIQNGVLKIAEDEDDFWLGLLGELLPDYYRNGDTERTFDELGFMDKFRNVLKPVGNLCLKIEDAVRKSKSDD